MIVIHIIQVIVALTAYIYLQKNLEKYVNKTQLEEYKKQMICDEMMCI